VWYLGSLTVDPREQNAGLGRRILEAAERRILALGGTQVVIDVLNVRGSLIAWYERRGYRLTGEAHPFPYEDSRYGVPQRADLAFLVLEKELAG
jgi:ribosomal protein S18 acetylase RimI-like enzyme